MGVGLFHQNHIMRDACIKRPKGFGASGRGKRREHFVEFDIMQYGIGAMSERSLPSSQQELSRSQSILMASTKSDFLSSYEF